jgi:hypothetical protein
MAELTVLIVEDDQPDPGMGMVLREVPGDESGCGA